MAIAYPLHPTTAPFWVSASGGRTSMMMARLIQQAFPDASIPFVFANTGEEHPATLEFVKDCQEHWGMPIVWVEAVVHHNERRSCTHQIVDYATAKRSGRGGPFEDVVKKYGLPSKMYPHCTRELKINPMYSYIRSIGFEGKSAVGIRGDEPKRLGKDPNIVYPMADWWPTTKQEVLAWWAKQPFDLKLAGEEEGNCLWCWQKSDKKQAINLERNPQWYDFPAYLEANYADIKAPIEPRRIFRGGRSTLQLIETINLN